MRVGERAEDRLHHVLHRLLVLRAEVARDVDAPTPSPSALLVASMARFQRGLSCGRARQLGAVEGEVLLGEGPGQRDGAAMSSACTARYSFQVESGVARDQRAHRRRSARRLPDDEVLSDSPRADAAREVRPPVHARAPCRAKSARVSTGGSPSSRPSSLGARARAPRAIFVSSAKTLRAAFAAGSRRRRRARAASPRAPGSAPACAGHRRRRVHEVAPVGHARDRPAGGTATARDGSFRSCSTHRPRKAARVDAGATFRIVHVGPQLPAQRRRRARACPGWWRCARGPAPAAGAQRLELRLVEEARVEGARLVAALAQLRRSQRRRRRLRGARRSRCRLR